MGRKAMVKFQEKPCGTLEETEHGYRFEYFPEYQGPPISLTMPLQEQPYNFSHFPPFFDGLLPEGQQLEALLRIHKIDQSDYLGQLIAVGGDLVGAVTVVAASE